MQTSLELSEAKKIEIDIFINFLDQYFEHQSKFILKVEHLITETKSNVLHNP